MKRTTQVATLAATNETEFALVVAEKHVEMEYGDLLLLIAQVCDAIASGDKVWLSIGATKKNDSLTLGLHDGLATTSIFGATFADLAAKAGSLI
jgi:hypothetical protein